MIFQNYSIQLLNTSKTEEFFNLINNNRLRLEDFFAGTVVKTKTLSDTNDYCKIIARKIEDKSYFPYVIVDSKTQKYIGFIDVKNIDWHIPKAELGYFIDVNYEGKGIISNAIGLLIEYLIETYNFKKLLCRSSNKNTGSIAVALKNGFELEGTIRRDYKTTKGEIVDLNYYGRIF